MYVSYWGYDNTRRITFTHWWTFSCLNKLYERALLDASKRRYGALQRAPPADTYVVKVPLFTTNTSRLSVALNSKQPLRSHVRELTFMLGSGGDGGVVTAAGCRARGRSSSCHLSVKPLHFFRHDVGTFPGHVCGYKDRYFKIRIISS